MPPADSKRLKFREFVSGDEPFVLQLLNEPPFLQFIGDKGVRNEADATRYLKEGPLASYRQHGFGLFHLSLKESGEAVGMCGFLQRDGLEWPDLGYAMLQSFAGRGLATEAARQMLDYGFSKLNFERVAAIVMPGNRKSCQLLERIGMQYDGQRIVQGIDGEQDLFSISRNSA